MPDPSKYKDKQEFMGDCIRMNMDEGKSHNQSVAICINMWVNKDKKKKKCASSILIGLAFKIIDK